MLLSFRLLLALVLFSAAASAASFRSGQAADVVLGQPDFETNTLVSGQPDRLAQPGAVAEDPATGKVFVAELSNNRVLRYSSAAAARNGSNPEMVFGQPNFSQHVSNQGSQNPTAQTFFWPTDVLVDSKGRLWVVDSRGHRVLCFFLAATTQTNDPPADLVLGQPDFTTGSVGTTAAKMSKPNAVSIGPDDTLWVADTNNHRVLRFANVSTKASGDPADGVLGQVNFTSGTVAAGNPAANTLSSPTGVHADSAGRLWVGDSGNHRVLRFDHAAATATATGGSAAAVLGQANLASNATLFPTGAANITAPWGLYLDPAGALWVSDFALNRVLRFSQAAALDGAAKAGLVLGQPDFGTTAAGSGARTLDAPGHLRPGPAGSLLVADFGNNRVLRFAPVADPAPAVRVASRHKLTTTRPKILLHGTASDPNGVLARVEIQVNQAAYRSARGTAAWKFSVPLRAGRNTVLVRAVDAGGAASPPVRVVIQRR